jgi:hypothetical protein
MPLPVRRVSAGTLVLNTVQQMWRHSERQIRPPVEEEAPIQNTYVASEGTKTF